MSVKMVPPSKRSVSDAELAPCMLCCHVHVSKEATCTRTKLMETQKFSFHFSNAIFPAFPFLPLFYPYLPSSNFSHTHQNSPQPFPFSLKPSSPSLQNHHHRWRSTVGFWRTKRYLVKVSLTSISLSPPVCFHIFLALFLYFCF